ncbi:MAG TPA: spore germination protein [Selenomonadales bacterium]|nr:spore germination protein [Selenomonadales bacterium]
MKKAPNSYHRLRKLSSAVSGAALPFARERLSRLRRLIGDSKEVCTHFEAVLESLLLSQPGEIQPTSFTSSLTVNENMLRTLFRDCEDIRYRSFVFDRRDALIVYLDGMVNLERLDESLRQLLYAGEPVRPELIPRQILASSAVQLVAEVQLSLVSVMRGSALLLVDGLAQALLFDLADPAKRPVQEAHREGVLRGPYDAFTETLSDNIVLVRRRTADIHVKAKTFIVGDRSRTRVVMIYVDNLAKHSLVSEVERRLKKIRIDKVLTAGMIEEFLVESPWSPFPQLQDTERPDKVVAALYEGRVAILTDNTPWALIAPCNYSLLMQSLDDYTTPPVIASLIRLTRHISAFLSVYLPGMYIAITSYHPSILPGSLALTIGELRSRAPFPAFLEAALMEAVLEVFQEAIARLPQKLVVAASVVGGFVIGTTVVEAGIINPLLVVVVSITAIASYAIPSYSLSLALRWLRIPVMILASVFGLYGLVVGALLTLTHMCALRSFGESYLGEIFNVTMLQDWKDSLVRLPMKLLRTRPKVFGPEDRTRVGGK